MQKNPLVSIIVRTKDRPTLLKRALQSISAQTYRPIEVVLVNDGGCDLDTLELKESLGDVSLNDIKLEENRGRAKAGNVGAENASGEYVGFLDDDDEFYPEHIETLVNFLKLNSGYGVAYSDCEIVRAGEQSIEAVGTQGFVAPADFSKTLLYFENYIPFMSVIFRKGILAESGGLDEKLELYEDWDLLLRISEQSSICHLGKLTTKYYYWSKTDQITARVGLAEEPYMKVVEKHFNKIAPSFLYENYLFSACKKERIEWLLESARRKDLLIAEKERVIEERGQILEEKESIISAREHVIAEQGRLILNKEQTIDAMHRTFEEMDAHISEIHNTLGWKILTKIRRLRDGIIPIGSRRRGIYEISMNSLKVIIDYGWKVFYTKASRRLKKEYFYMKSIGNRTDNYDLAGAPCIPAPRSRPVNIVIPVFNAFDVLTQCVDSVLRCTDLELHNLVIIDDCSADGRVRDFLNSLEQHDKNMKILFHAKNMGFVKTANEGMQMFAGNDVIILNSDTRVTAGWVEKLQRAAYSRSDIATVTPFSNNATLCSIPVFLEDNRIPIEFDIQSFGDFIENVSLRYYPELPTAVGFCMYIKRPVLQDIGLFDEESFGKGYGEENDFCWRARRKGYRHILDDATFIYHKGGESFTQTQKVGGEQRAIALLDTMHPDYLPVIFKFIKDNPLKPIHDYINIRLDLFRRKGGKC